MRNDLTELVFILDRSGSMHGLEKDTIGGFNSVLERNKALPGDANITTILFDHRFTILHDRQPPHTLARHRPHRPLGRVVRRHGHDAVAHRVRHRELPRLLSRRHAAQHEVAVGHDAAHPPVRAPHREQAQIVPRHQPCRRFRRFLGPYAHHVRRHAVPDLHTHPSTVILWKFCPSSPLFIPHRNGFPKRLSQHL